MLAGNILRNWYFSIVIVAGHNFWRIAPQFVFTERPKEEENKIINWFHDEKGTIMKLNGEKNEYLQRRRTWTLTPFSFSWRTEEDMFGLKERMKKWWRRRKKREMGFWSFDLGQTWFYYPFTREPFFHLNLF
jgi:hypothetical protein